MKTTLKLWIGVGILIILSPLGLILPEYFRGGDAWGEWGAEGIKELVGYIPAGLEKLSGVWSAPLPDYAFSGWEAKGLGEMSLAYIFSALVGIVITVAAVVLIGKLLRVKE